jgi:hypothetical protein
MTIAVNGDGEFKVIKQKTLTKKKKKFFFAHAAQSKTQNY